MRKHRILEKLPTLMDITPAEYRRLCYDSEAAFEPALASGTVLHNISFLSARKTFTRGPVIPIMPSLDLTSLADKLLAELVD